MAKSNKGISDLASVLQKRMNKTSVRVTGVQVETGEIMAGRKLKLSSLPGTILDTDDYSVCASLQTKMPCQSSYPFGAGDQVLVVWTFDGEPVVIDKIARADSGNALTECIWECTCPELARANKRINTLENNVSNINDNISGINGNIEGLTNDISNLKNRVEGLE